MRDGGAWSVIDFDDAMFGDPAFEIGRFLALLVYDLPLLAGGGDGPSRLLEQACEAYLAGYGPDAAIDSCAVNWYRAAVLIFVLARMIMRDKLDEPGRQAVIQRIQSELAALPNRGFRQSLGNP